MKKLSRILWIVSTMLLILLMIEGAVTENKVYFFIALYVIFIVIFKDLNDKQLKWKDEQLKWQDDYIKILERENLKLINKLSICKVYLEMIKVPQSFKEHPPAISKLSKRFNYYDKHKEFKVPIVVDNNLNLIDGYTSYLIAKKRKIDIVEVEVEKGETANDN